MRCIKVFNARVRFTGGRAGNSDDLEEDVMYGTTTFARDTITRGPGSNSSPNLSTHKGMGDGIAMTVSYNFFFRLLVLMYFEFQVTGVNV